MSLIVMTGKSVPNSLFVFGFIFPGPKEPMQPPITLAQITKNLFVSIAFDGPMT